MGEQGDRDLGDWRDDGACRDSDDAEVWWPGSGGTAAAAFRTCRGCPVRRDCLAAALAVPIASDFGVWGGTSEISRRRIRSGHLTVDEAFARGNAIADRRTDDEQLADDEPWLTADQGRVA